MNCGATASHFTCIWFRDAVPARVEELFRPCSGPRLGAWNAGDERCIVVSRRHNEGIEFLFDVSSSG
jgi:hypothetical protein